MSQVHIIVVSYPVGMFHWNLPKAYSSKDEAEKLAAALNDQNESDRRAGCKLKSLSYSVETFEVV